MPYHTCESCGEIAFEEGDSIYCQVNQSWYCCNECAKTPDCNTCKYINGCNIDL